MSPNNDSNQDKTQSQSWEIEILISGGAFFSLYQLSGFFVSMIGKVIGTFAWGPVTFVASAVRLLAVYFAIHLSVRAFWLSLLLLRKIYPEGINLDRLKMAEPFKSAAQRFRLDQRTAYVDKLSSLIFSWAVTFVSVFLGIALAITLIVAVSHVMSKLAPDLSKQLWWRVIRISIFLTFLVFLLDTFMYGPLRRSRTLSKYYYPIYLIWDKVSLGFLWRPPLQVIFSNVRSKWRASVLVILVTPVIVFLSGDEEDFIRLFRAEKQLTENTVVAEWKYSDRLRADEPWRDVSIQSDVIKDDYLRIFVSNSVEDEKYLDTAKVSNKSLSNLIQLSIDDSVYMPGWVGLIRSDAENGIQTVLDISHLENKIHILTIHRTHAKDTVKIPFWKL